MNRKLLSLITILCIFTVSLLGQVAYASDLDSANIGDQVTINALPHWLINWETIKGATTYRLSCRDITNGEDGPLLFSNRDVGNVIQYDITDKKLIQDHYYRVYIAGYKAGQYIDHTYKFFTYTDPEY